MSFIIKPFNLSDHLSSTVDAVTNLRNTDPSYPSPLSVGVGRDDLGEWLLNETFVHRWVAVDKMTVVGHVGLVSPHSYLHEYCVGGVGKYVEVSKFFVDPTAQKFGVGNSLFTQATNCAQMNGLITILAVLETSVKAYRFYLKNGFTLVDEFVGSEGKNFVFALQQ